MIYCPLFVPADSEKKLHKALHTNADCLFIDLEDSVALPNKAFARKYARQFIEQNKTAKQKLYVRINALTTQEYEKDLHHIMPAKPHGIVLPKSQSGKDVAQLDEMLQPLEAQNKIANGTTKIVAIITETALGISQATQYKNCSQRLVALAWGAEDITAEIGATDKRKKNGEYTDLIKFARTQTLLGATIAGVQPLDAVYDDFDNTNGLQQECAAAYFDGFKGKMAIHPAQIDIIKTAFTPSTATIAQAKKIVAAFAKNKNAGVISLDGKMLDKPHLIQAQNILKQIDNK